MAIKPPKSFTVATYGYSEVERLLSHDFLNQDRVERVEVISTDKADPVRIIIDLKPPPNMPGAGKYLFNRLCEEKKRLAELKYELDVEELAMGLIDSSKTPEVYALAFVKSLMTKQYIQTLECSIACLERAIYK